VRGLDRAAADGNRAAHEFVDSERVQCRRYPHYVGDRIDGADLMEVHVIGRDAMNGCFRLREQ
jgi:hypothetical protein